LACRFKLHFALLFALLVIGFGPVQLISFSFIDSLIHELKKKTNIKGRAVCAGAKRDKPKKKGM